MTTPAGQIVIQFLFQPLLTIDNTPSFYKHSKRFASACARDSRASINYRVSQVLCTRISPYLLFFAKTMPLQLRQTGVALATPVIYLN